MEEKILQVKLIGYKIKGIAKFEDFFNNIGYIQIEEFVVDNIDKTEEEWFKLLNDNNIQSKYIVGGYLHILELYEENIHKYKNSIFIKSFTSEDLSKIEIKI